MRPRSRIVLLALATALALAIALLLLLGRPATPSSTGTSTSTGASAADGPGASGFYGALLPGHVPPPPVTLTDQHGRRVSLAQYRGRVTILTFLSTACAPTCPLVAQQIRGALDELETQPAGTHPTRTQPAGTQPAPANPIPVLIVSADPATDTPARVRRFLAEAALTGRAEYLTGTPAELAPVWHAYSVVPGELSNAASPHPAEVLLLDRAGDERVLYQVEELTPEGLANDVRRLEGER
jgi:protein SCO1/2